MSACMRIHIQLLKTPWIVACQAPLSMRFSRQQYLSRLPFSSPGDLPYPGIEPGSPAFQILYHLSHQGSPLYHWATREAWQMRPHFQRGRSSVGQINSSVSIKERTTIWLAAQLQVLQFTPHPHQVTSPMGHSSPMIEHGRDVLTMCMYCHDKYYKILNVNKIKCERQERGSWE